MKTIKHGLDNRMYVALFVAITASFVLMSVGLLAQQDQSVPNATTQQILERLGSLEKQIADLNVLLRSLLPTGPVIDILPVRLAIASAPIKGSPQAKVVLIEYSDFQCPFCGQHATTVYPQLQKLFVDAGNIRYVFRHFPLEPIHPNALKAAEAAECANQQGKFWEYHDRLFANQKALTPAALVDFATMEKLSIAAFQSCLETGKGLTRVREDVAEATRLGFSGTPGFLFGTVQDDGSIRVTRQMTGAQPLRVFESELNTLMELPRIR